MLLLAGSCGKVLVPMHVRSMQEDYCRLGSSQAHPLHHALDKRRTHKPLRIYFFDEVVATEYRVASSPRSLYGTGFCTFEVESVASSIVPHSNNATTDKSKG